jgi:hypothetical protein
MANAAEVCRPKTGVKEGSVVLTAKVPYKTGGRIPKPFVLRGTYVQRDSIVFINRGAGRTEKSGVYAVVTQTRSDLQI